MLSVWFITNASEDFLNISYFLGSNTIFNYYTNEYSQFYKKIPSKMKAFFAFCDDLYEF